MLPDQKTYAGYLHGIRSLPQPVLNFCQEDNEPQKCCPGYYGKMCKECPGGVSNPCSGQGNCQSNGVCSCQSPYSGEVCDLCDDQLCKSVDHCSINNGGCHPFADCIFADTLVTCKCAEGYIGDGHHCVSPCQIEKGGCHENASCELEYKEARCRCDNGFTGNGKQCRHVLGPCDYDNGGCSMHALCIYKLAYNQTIICTCEEGYTGNGITCLTNAWKTLKDMAHDYPTIKPFIQMLMKAENMKVKSLMEDVERNVTVFVPVSGDLSNMTGANFVSNSLVLLDTSETSDLEVRCLDLSRLKVTVDSNASETLELEFHLNGVFVLVKNILATNGLLHLINNTFTVNTLIEEQQQTTSKQSFDFTKMQHLTIWEGLGVLAGIALVVVVLVMGWRKQRSIISAFNRFRASNGFRVKHLQEERQDEPQLISVSFHPGLANLAFNDSSEGGNEYLPVSST